MNLYLLRHGIAVARGQGNYPNDDRPLTDEGIDQMQTVSKGIENMELTFDVVLTSPLQRAAETARIVARTLHCEDKMEICNALAPGGATKDLLSELNNYKSKASLLLVGHEPDLSALAGTLLGAKGLSIDFKKAGLCNILVSEIPPLTPGTLIWHLTPKQMMRMAK